MNQKDFDLLKKGALIFNAWRRKNPDEQIDLLEADLQWANLQGANLQDANLQDANLRWANLRGANMQWSRLEGADLYIANLEGADLHFLDLRVTKLEEADLLDAKLKYSKLEYPVGPYVIGMKEGNYFCATCGRIDKILRFKGISDFCPTCIIKTLEDLCPKLKDLEEVKDG